MLMNRNAKPTAPSRPAKVDLESNPTFNRYVISGKQGIQSVLKAIIDKRRMLSVWQKKGDNFFLATLLGFDPTTNQIWLERSRHELAWQNNLSDGLLCCADIDKVQVQFTLRDPKPGSFRNESAWVATLPSTLVRLQRREYFRMPFPVGKPAFCKIKGINAYGCPSQVRVQLVDISAGGIGFAAPITMTNAFPRDIQYKECELKLPDEEVMTLDLDVRNSFLVTTRSGVRTLRVGVEFSRLPNSKMSAIQRVITAIEREKRLLAEQVSG